MAKKKKKNADELFFFIAIPGNFDKFVVLSVWTDITNNNIIILFPKKSLKCSSFIQKNLSLLKTKKDSFFKRILRIDQQLLFKPLK